MGYFFGPFRPEKVQFLGDVDSVLAKRELEVVQSGFFFTEGPTWLPDEDALLFSDIPHDRIYRWTKSGGAEVFLENSGGFDG